MERFEVTAGWPALLLWMHTWHTSHAELKLTAAGQVSCQPSLEGLPDSGLVPLDPSGGRCFIGFSPEDVVDPFGRLEGGLVPQGFRVHLAPQSRKPCGDGWVTTDSPKQVIALYVFFCSKGSSMFIQVPGFTTNIGQESGMVTCGIAS